MTNEKQLITGSTQLLGVIGYPVKHSLSPVMHNAAIAHLQRDFVYVPFPIEPQNLHYAISGFAAIGVVGFNVTIPHKQTILPFLSQIEPIAKSVGAVNTVCRQDDQLIGTNTDVEGFLAPLLTYAQDWSQKVVVILGYGGAARAVVAACTQLGCSKIYVVGRNIQKLKEFRNSWENSHLKANIDIYQWDELSNLIEQAHLLVNATPIGMAVDESPLSADELTHLPTGAIAYDLIYNPNPTKFLQLAKQQGATTIDGLEMLVQQGAAALKIWLQQDTVPVDIMRQAVRQYLGLSG
jgi:shikimate dehydrogenase